VIVVWGLIPGPHGPHEQVMPGEQHAPFSMLEDNVVEMVAVQESGHRSVSVLPENPAVVHLLEDGERCLMVIHLGPSNVLKQMPRQSVHLPPYLSFSPVVAKCTGTTPLPSTANSLPPVGGGTNKKC